MTTDDRSDVALRVAVRAGRVGLWEWEIDTGRVAFSREWKRQLGYGDDEVTEDLAGWEGPIHPEDLPVARRWIAGCRSEGGPGEVAYRMRHKDGSWRWFRVQGELAQSAPSGGQYFIGSAVDITDGQTTEQRRTEQEMREREARFRQVSENIDEVFWLTDLARETGAEHDHVLMVSPAYARVWGRSCESLLADPLSWLESIHVDDRARVAAAWEALTTKGHYDLEYRIVRPDGGIRWIRDRAFPVRDPAGRMFRVAGVADDITERRRLQEHVREAQKMEAIGQLAGSIAHDFNNLLVVIQMQTSMLLFDHELTQAVRQGVEGIVDAANRAANLTRQLLTFSRRGARQTRRVDLLEIVGMMTRLLERLLGEDISLVTVFATHLPPVNVDPGMVEQVLMNLAVNARDAMPTGGTLRLTLGAVAVDTETAARNPGVEAGDFVRLSVADTGSGIDPVTLPHIFEPFFTTKPLGQGTGLGLATVFGILRQHAGFVEVQSALGVGSEFRTYFPASADVSSPVARSVAQGQEGGTETILVVEDDAQVRLMVRVVLERYGYTIVEANSARTALALWPTHAAAIDLLLIDLVLPGGISGKALALELSAKKPAVRVIYMSGYTSDLVLGDLGADCYFLHKPFAAYELNTIVRQCLRNQGPPPLV